MANQQNIDPHKWKPGQSGNPNGRPKGFKGLSQELKKMIDADGEYIIQQVHEVDAKNKKTGRYFERAVIAVPRKSMLIMTALNKAMKLE